MTDPVILNAHQSIKQGSKSFALASRIFAPDMRSDASMLYAWCRYCDDVVDGQVMGHSQLSDYKSGQRERLEQLEQQTSSALKGDDGPDDPIFIGLARVFQKHDIPHRHAFELLQGFRMDADARSYNTVPELLDYCYHVAGVVGVMMAHVMGVREQTTLDRASDLGLAFQLTNIARDIVDDAQADRVYVPSQLLEETGAPLEPSKLACSDNWPQAHIAALELLDTAEQYYQSARTGIRRLPFRCAWAIVAALSVYREIGEVLRARGPLAWQERVSASAGRKFWLALSSVGGAITRSSVKDYSRNGLYSRPT